MSEIIGVTSAVNLLAPLLAAVSVISSVRTSQKVILNRLDRLEKSIDKAHDRLDKHILEWHK